MNKLVLAQHQNQQNQQSPPHHHRPHYQNQQHPPQLPLDLHLAPTLDFPTRFKIRLRKSHSLTKRMTNNQLLITTTMTKTKKTTIIPTTYRNHKNSNKLTWYQWSKQPVKKMKYHILTVQPRYSS